MSREILMSIFRIYAHLGVSIQVFFFILQFSEQCLERITKQQWSILTYTTTYKLFVCLFVYLFIYVVIFQTFLVLVLQINRHKDQ